MTENLRIIDRKELYERVWQTPMWQLCKEFGLSDRGLAKICRSAQIPVPGRGYWRKKELGQLVEKEPLPEPERHQEIGYSVKRRVKPEEDGAEESPRSVARKPHPLVVATREYEKAPWDVREKLAVCPLNTRATRSLLTRALGIWDQVIKVLEGKGVQVVNERPDHTVVCIESQKIPIHVEETFISKLNAHRLAICIDSAPYGFRQSFRDGMKQRVEDLIPEFIATLFAVAKARHEEQLKEQERERRWQEARARQLAEEKRWERLDSEVLAYESKLRIMRYLRMIQRVQVAHPTEERKLWIDWIDSRLKDESYRDQFYGRPPERRPSREFNWETGL